ncbi:MAG: hypothetical protein WDO69_31995 [Pseudomonadota bacterium]
MHSKLAWVYALSTFILAGTAHAQAPPPEWNPPQYLAHISIQAAPSTELEVVPSGGGTGSAAVAHCTEYCDFWALPGKYTLYSRDHSTGERKDLSLHIKQSSRFELEAGDDDARTTGLVLGIGGSAAIITGFILIAPALFSAMCEGPCETKGEQDAAAVGLGLLLAGAIVTPIGWTMYVHNRTRLKRIDERSRRANEITDQVRVGVMSIGLRGLGLGGVATF